MSDICFLEYWNTGILEDLSAAHIHFLYEALYVSDAMREDGAGYAVYYVYFLNPLCFFILFPTKFQAGIFFSVLLTGWMSQTKKMRSTAMPMRQVSP